MNKVMPPLFIIPLFQGIFFLSYYHPKIALAVLVVTIFFIWLNASIHNFTRLVFDEKAKTAGQKTGWYLYPYPYDKEK